MHQRFGKWIRGKLESLGEGQKWLVGEIDTAMSPNGTVAFVTLQSKLSKLLGGNPEGVAFFRAKEKPWRWKALGTALRLPAGELDGAWERYEQCVSLVVDPRLDEGVREFFESQQQDPRANYEVIHVDVDAQAEDLLGALRDKARLAEKPVIVALADTSDIMFLSGAEIPWSPVRAVQRGYEVTSEPTLIPIPLAKEPNIFASDGSPLRPVPDSEQFGWGNVRGDDFYATHIAPAREIGELPSLPVLEAIQWLTRPGGPFYNEGAALSRTSKWHKVELMPDGPEFGRYDLYAGRTQVWMEDNLIMALGHSFAEVHDAFAPHHKVHVSAWEARWSELTPASLNPGYWLRQSHDQVCTGLPDDEPRREAFMTAIHAHWIARWEEFGPKPISAIRRAKNQETDSLRAVLFELAQRRIHARSIGPYDQAPEAIPLLGWAAPFVLERAAKARWLLAEATPAADRQWTVLADMGAGELLWITVIRCDEPATDLFPQQLRVSSRDLSFLDGGDFLLRAEYTHSRGMSGSLLVDSGLPGAALLNAAEGDA